MLGPSTTDKGCFFFFSFEKNESTFAAGRGAGAVVYHCACIRRAAVGEERTLDISDTEQVPSCACTGMHSVQTILSVRLSLSPSLSHIHIYVSSLCLMPLPALTHSCCRVSRTTDVYLRIHTYSCSRVGWLIPPRHCRSPPSRPSRARVHHSLRRHLTCVHL